VAGQTRELEELRGRLQAEAEGVRSRREELVGELQDRQRKLKLVFDDLMRQVASRFNELSTELERHCQRGIEIAEGTLNAALEKIASIDTVILQNR
jgi:predicted nuclease with TOPRIM domain